MKSPLLLLFAVAAIAQNVTAPAPLTPLSGFDRQLMIEDMRKMANGRRWFAEVYAGGGNTIGGEYSYHLADGMDWAADFVENWVSHEPEPDPVEQRHKDELVVINSLRQYYGLPLLERYPDN